ncbi:dermonecrotic toxin domain-containing protein [Pseudomonas massiliensis]|uniref:dermonecrotic toxin domain-containing protein n=1 Tax=Pseudomonas massiliensis TaxID=522492 RepID=UPI000694BE5F|nr:DUF6543 domain-containing protein [Pseudomonas massiliensis]
MNPLDSLLETPVQPLLPSVASQQRDGARGILAAGQLLADAPVDWLHRVADTLAAKAAGQADWSSSLPQDLRAMASSMAEEQAAEAWQVAVDEALRQQADAFVYLLELGSQPADYPRLLNRSRQAAHRARLLARFGEEAPALADLSAYQAAFRARHQAQAKSAAIMGTAAAFSAPNDLSADLSQLLEQAIVAELRLRAEEGALEPGIAAMLDAPDGPGGWQWLAVTWNGATLAGAWVLTLPQAWGSRVTGLPLLLWVQGESGGLAHFEDLASLYHAIAADVQAPLPTALARQAQDAPAQGDGAALVPLAAGGATAIQALLQPWVQRFAALAEGNWPWPELDQALAQERMLDEARSALAIPMDSQRRLALTEVERQWQADALLEHLPTWLLSRPLEQREGFAQRLLAYHEAASQLEAWLSEQVPDFAVFAGRLLAERIEHDLGLEIKPDTVVASRPTHMTFEWFGNGTNLEPPPEGLFPRPPVNEHGPGGLRWVPSDTWEQVTLAELAMENLDADEAAETERLKAAHWLVPGLTAGYLIEILPVLDPLKQYDAHVRRSLDPARAPMPERLRRPFELELQLLAQVMHWSRRLSTRGQTMLQAAATEQDPARLAEQGLRLHWLVIHMDQELGQTVQGCCALVHAEDGHTLLHLPGAPDGFELIEHRSLSHALDTLRRGIASQSTLAEYVAQRLGGDPKISLAYFRQAALHHYDDYLRAPASLDQTLVCLQLDDRCFWLRARAAAQGRSQRGIHVARHLALQERYLGYLRAAMAMMPGVGTLVGLQTLYESASMVRSGWRQQDADLVGVGVVGVLGGILDVLLSSLPVASSLASVRQAVRAQAVLRQARQPLAGYEARLRLPGATALAGADAGTWLHDGQRYICQDGRAYAVYRRPGETTLRLRATATRRYEAPVRREGERWVTHADVGLRGGGGKLTLAENVFATWGPGSRHEPFTGATRTRALAQGRRLLNQYSFPNATLEAEFAFAYLADGIPPAWALRYRTGPGAAVVVAPVTDAWQAVRWTPAGSDDFTPSGRGGLVHLAPRGQGQPTEMVRLRGHYYPLLRGGGQEAERFIAPAGPAPASLAELDELILQGLGPVRVRLGATPAEAPTLIGPYTQTFAERLGERFPHLAPAARRAWAEIVYRRASQSAQGLTQQRLRAIERLIADDTAEPLRALFPRMIDSLVTELARRDLADSFSQVHWSLTTAERTALQQALAGQGAEELRMMMNGFLVGRGYSVLFDHAIAGRYLSVFRRPGRPEIYVLVQLDRLGAVNLYGNHGASLLTQPWLDMVIPRISNVEAAAVVRAARYRGELVPVLGGATAPSAASVEIIWERVFLLADIPGAPLAVRSWRSALRPIQPGDVESAPGSGMFRNADTGLIEGARVHGQWLPVFPVADDTRLLLSRPADLPTPLTFDALNRCIRERFAEQPWLVAREGTEWSVRRHLFLAPLDRQLGRTRPGLTPPSAFSVAEAAFARAQGSDHARLLHLEHVLSSWVHNSHAQGDLADPLLLLSTLSPERLEGGLNWRLALPPDIATPAPGVLYLRPVEQYTQGLLETVRRPRMRHHAFNLADDLLVRYGLIQEHRVGRFAQYRQPSTGRVYVVAVQIAEADQVLVAADEGLEALSSTWIARWRERLAPRQAEALAQAVDQGRLVRLLAALRLDAPAEQGVLALIRLSEF